MAGRASLGRVSIADLARRALAVALATACCACAGFDPVGFAVVAQDQYDFLTCPQIVDSLKGQINREKDLKELIAKAESAPGGIIVSYTAYQSELATTRGRIAAASRAALKNGCDTSK
jgi:hypothetical protein